MIAKPSALLIGAGDIASRLCPLLQEAGFKVTGVRRRASTSSVFDAIEQADISIQKDCERVVSTRPAVIVITLTPDDYSDTGYEHGYVKPAKVLANILAKMKDYRPLVIFVSSTSVYGQTHGEWVNEQSDTLPQGFSGKRLLEAERALAESSQNYCVVRFSGIYGPGRERLLTRIKQKTVKLTAAWTNRIHSDDCAGFLAHLIKQFNGGEELELVYIGTDNMPARQADVIQFIANEYGITLEQPNDIEVVENAQGKRLSNQQLLRSGYTLNVADYLQGYNLQGYKRSN